jgi:hypothetical protein
MVSFVHSEIHGLVFDERQEITVDGHNPVLIDQFIGCGHDQVPDRYANAHNLSITLQCDVLPCLGTADYFKLRL